MEKVFYTNNKKNNLKFIAAIRNINSINNKIIDKIFSEIKDEEIRQFELNKVYAKHKKEIEDYCTQNLKTTCENLIKSKDIKKQNKFKKLEYILFYRTMCKEEDITKADIIIYDGKSIVYYKKSALNFTIYYLTAPIKIYNHAVEKITDSFEKKIYECREDVYKFYLKTYTTQHAVLKYNIDKEITDARDTITNDDLIEEYQVANKLIA